MSKANTKDGDAAEKLLDVFDGVTDGLRVSRAIRKENAIRFEIENVLRGRLRGDNPDVAMVINEQPQYILLDAKIVRRYTKLSRIRNAARLAHRFRPGRNGEFDRAFLPAIRLLAGHAAGEFLSRHRGQLLRFEDQLFSGSSVGSYNTAHSPNIANVADERTRVDIPDSRDFMTI